MNNLIELAKAAMQATVEYHAELERQRFLVWKSSPIKGRKTYEPMADNQAVCATFADLFGETVVQVKNHAPKEKP